MNRKPFHILAAVLIGMTTLLVPLSGCNWVKDTPYTLTEAEHKLAVFCREEGDLTIITHRVGKTVWVYAPLSEPLFRLKPSPSHENAEKQKSPFAFLFLEGNYDEAKNFAISYDMVRDVLPSKPTTYGSAYNENYSKKHQLVFQGLQESFFNVPPVDAPDFIVLVMADVLSGVGSKTIVYLPDLKAYMTEAIPPDEYYLRENNEIFGNDALINDGIITKNAFIRPGVNTETLFADLVKHGYINDAGLILSKFDNLKDASRLTLDPKDASHKKSIFETLRQARAKTGAALVMTDVSWTDFLAKQMETRIKFKFTQSDFPPKSDPDKAIVAIVANTLRFYPFKDYQGLYLYDLRGKHDMLFNKKQLKTFEEKTPWEDRQGRLTTIHFDGTKFTTGNTSDQKD